MSDQNSQLKILNSQRVTFFNFYVDLEKHITNKNLANKNLTENYKDFITTLCSKFNELKIDKLSDIDEIENLILDFSEGLSLETQSYDTCDAGDGDAVASCDTSDTNIRNNNNNPQKSDKLRHVCFERPENVQNFVKKCLIESLLGFSDLVANFKSLMETEGEKSQKLLLQADSEPPIKPYYPVDKVLANIKSAGDGASTFGASETSDVEGYDGCPSAAAAQISKWKERAYKFRDETRTLRQQIADCTDTNDKMARDHQDFCQEMARKLKKVEATNKKYRDQMQNHGFEISSFNEILSNDSENAKKLIDQNDVLRENHRFMTDKIDDLVVEAETMAFKKNVDKFYEEKKEYEEIISNLEKKVAILKEQPPKIEVKVVEKEKEQNQKCDNCETLSKKVAEFKAHHSRQEKICCEVVQERDEVEVEKKKLAVQLKQVKSDFDDLKIKSIKLNNQVTQQSVKLSESQTTINNLKIAKDILIKAKTNTKQQNSKSTDSSLTLTSLQTQLSDFKQKYKLTKDELDSYKNQVKHVDKLLKLKEQQDSELIDQTKYCQNFQNALEEEKMKKGDFETRITKEKSKLEEENGDQAKKLQKFLDQRMEDLKKIAELKDENSKLISNLNDKSEGFTPVSKGKKGSVSSTGNPSRSPTVKNPWKKTQLERENFDLKKEVEELKTQKAQISAEKQNLMQLLEDHWLAEEESNKKSTQAPTSRW